MTAHPMLRSLLPSWLILLAALPAPGQSSIETGPGLEPMHVDGRVEPEVVDALRRAVSSMPAAHRAFLAGIVVAREPGRPVAGDPLLVRLQSAATLASYGYDDGRLVVTDAGAAGAPRWLEPAATREEVVGLVAPLADVLGVERPAGPDDSDALEGAWAALVERLGLPGDPRPAPGDPTVLDRFVRWAVEGALGGPADLEGILVHELGHAVESRAGLDGWACLSGWREATSGEECDGYVGGAFAREDPIVLVRLLLAGGRGPSPTYRPSEAAAFPTPYAAYDPREDFAECYRLFVADPDRLAESAPGKFLALDAVGWTAGHGDREPGPLRFDPERLLSGPWPARIARGVESVLGSADALDAMAILRAHREVLVRLPLACDRRPGEARWPEDLPEAVRPAEGLLEVEVAGGVLAPSPTSIASAADRRYERWEDLVEFEVGMVALRGDWGESPSAEDVAAVLDARPADELPVYLARWQDRPGPSRLRVLLAAAADHPRCGREPFVRALLAGRAGEGVEVDPGWPAYRRAAVLAAAAEAAIEDGRTEEALAAALAIPGRTLGAARRARILARLGRTDEARRELAGIGLPGLARRVEAELVRRGDLDR